MGVRRLEAGCWRKTSIASEVGAGNLTMATEVHGVMRRWWCKMFQRVVSGT